MQLMTRDTHTANNAIPIIGTHLDAIADLCQRHEVAELYVFGSVLTEDFGEESDVDLLVTFKPMDLFDYFDNYMSLQSSFEKLFERDVDLVETQAIRNPILQQEIDDTKYLIYGQESAKVSA